MKRFYLPVFFTFFFGISHAQLYVQQWASCKDEPSTLINTTHMTTDRFGNTYMAGTEKDIFEPDFPPHMFILKINAAGTFSWKKYYNALKDSSDEVKGIATDAQGNVYLTGSRMQVGSCDVCPNYAIKDIFTTKYAPNGNIIWRNRFKAGDFKLSTASEIKVTTNGYSLVTGYIKEYSSLFFTFNYTMTALLYGPEGNLITSIQAPDIIAYSGTLDKQLNLIVAGEEMVSNVGKPVVAKFNKRGNLLWKTILDESNRKGTFYNVFIDNEGGIYANGQANNVSFSQPNIVTAKYDRSGMQIWKRSEMNRTFTGKGSFGDYEVDALGNSYICGYQDYGATDRDWLTIRYDKNGTKKWSKVFADPVMFGNYPQDIELTKNGQLLVSGNGTPSAPIVYSYNTIMYDTSGTQLWQAYYSVNPGQNSLSVGARMDAAGNIYAGGSGVCVVKYKPNIIAATAQNSVALWNVKPNPAYNEITISGKNIQSFTILNTLGLVVKKGILNSNEVMHHIDVNTLNTGTYFIEIETLNGRDKKSFQKL